MDDLGVPDFEKPLNQLNQLNQWTSKRGGCSGGVTVPPGLRIWVGVWILAPSHFWCSKVIQSQKNLDLTGRYRENIPLIFLISRVCMDSNRVGGDRPRVGRIFKGDPTDPG